MQVPIRPSIASTWAFGLGLAIAPIADATAQEIPAPSPAPPFAPPLVATAPAKIYLSAWLAELLKLAQAGIEEEILLTFINAVGTFNLTSEQIIYLRDLGVSNAVINAIIQHDLDLATGVRQMPPATVPPLPSAPLTTLGSSTPNPSPPSSQAATPPAPSATAPNPGLPVIMPSSAAAEPEFTATEEPKDLLPPEEPVHSPAQQLTLSPVRAPYPVKLTDPILVIRATGRMPNTMLLESFP